MGASVRAKVLLASLVCLAITGCGAFRCGCSDGCGAGREFAFMRYEARCERCGDPAWGGPGCVAGSCGCNYCGPSGSCGGCESCGGGCSSCTGCGDACECGDACGECKECRVALLDRLSRMFCCKARSGCRGCGELYWNEWFNDPPSGCEPCNCHGQYVGRGATTPNEMPLQSFGEAPSAAPMSAVPPLELAPPPATEIEHPASDATPAPTDADLEATPQG